jgi:MoaA/NifB/PqqE/SkfB family radical SAM enzyme
MKFIGRDIEAGLIYAMLKEHPYSSLLQGLQKLRQIARIDYKLFKNGKSFYPTIIAFEITHRCNLRCKTCWFWGEHGKYSQGGNFEIMSLDEIKNFIDSIASFRPYFLLTGGEPFLYPNIEEVVRYASSRGLFVGLITNGMLGTEKNIKNVLDAGLNFITVSLDSPQKTVHNNIRGNKNSFDNAIKTLRTLKRLKGTRHFPITPINLTVSKFNYRQLNGILKIAQKAGINVLQFQHQWFSDFPTSITYTKWAKNNLGLKSDHIKTFETCAALETNGALLYKSLKSMRDNPRGNYIRVYPDLNEKETITYYQGMSPVFNERCINPWFGIIVKPNGDVVPCIDYIVGNVKKESFKEIWNSDKMKLFRRKVKEQGYFPGCTRCCGFFQR